MDELTIKIPATETVQVVRQNWRASKHCGTFAFITIQAILIAGMLKIALNSPITDAEFFLPFGAFFTIYSACIMRAVITPLRYASK
jgi:hypothetical protein